MSIEFNQKVVCEDCKELLESEYEIISEATDKCDFCDKIGKFEIILLID